MPYPRPRFHTGQIKRFLVALDGNLEGPFSLTVIGSGAAMLAYGLRKDTTDLDTVVSLDAIAQAIGKTQEETGIALPVDFVFVHQPPEGYEARLQRLVTPELEWLEIYVPEKHDWAIMKVARLRDKDLEHILDVARRIGLSQNILLDRFVNEMWMSHGNKNDLIYNFVAAMAELFGKKRAKDMEKTIRADRRWAN